MSEEKSPIFKLEGKMEAPQNYKGKIIILNFEQSEIAKNLRINEKGTYALKSR